MIVLLSTSVQAQGYWAAASGKKSELPLLCSAA
jgi:hypothetical protein